MSIPFAKLNLHVDMLYLFRRIERNLRRGVPRERVLLWVRAQAVQAVPSRSVWHHIVDEHHPDIVRSAGAGEIRAAVLEHCTAWTDYIIRHQPQPEPGEDGLLNAQIEQLRLKL